MWLNSIKGRLIAIVVLLQALLAAGVLFAGVYYTHRRLLATLDATIESRAMSVAALVRYTEDASGNVYFDDTLMPGSIDPGHPDLYAVWTERSGLLRRSANWPAGLNIARGDNRTWVVQNDGVPYRVRRIANVPVLDKEEGTQFHPQSLTIVYAAPTLRVRQQTEAAGAFIAIASLLFLSLTTLLALWGIGRGLQPLQNLADGAARVSANNWELSLSPSVSERTELRPVAESMTTMLARLRRSFDQQREFVGNAAHELKTPLAVLKSTLQSLLYRPRSSEEYRAGVESALEDLERLERLVQWMLRLARAEQWAQGGSKRELPLLDVSASCLEAVEQIRSLAEARQMQIRLSRNGPVVFRADPEDLQLVWTNLLDNAVRHSPEGESVEVKVEQADDGSARVSFEDHGSGIDPADLPHIFERFYRGDPSRTRSTGGFGLGLAIAKALVEAYGGKLSASSELGKGTRMTVELPPEKTSGAQAG